MERRPCWLLVVGCLVFALLGLSLSAPGVSLAADDEDQAEDPLADLKEAFEQGGLEWFDGSEGEADTEAVDPQMVGDGPAGESSPAEQPLDDPDVPPDGQGDASDAAPVTTEEAPAEATDAIERFEAMLYRIARGVVPTPGLSDEDRAEGIDDGSLLLLADIAMSLRDAEVRGDDTADLEAAVYALSLFMLLRSDAGNEDSATGAGDPPMTNGAPAAVAVVTEPKTKVPPKLTGKPKRKFQKQGRAWVWLPAPVVIKTNYPTVGERTLKAGVWYQMKEHAEGDREFFTKKGSRIGTSLPDDRDTFKVRRWNGSDD